MCYIVQALEDVNRCILFLLLEFFIKPRNYVLYIYYHFVDDFEIGLIHPV